MMTIDERLEAMALAIYDIQKCDHSWAWASLAEEQKDTYLAMARAAIVAHQVGAMEVYTGCCPWCEDCMGTDACKFTGKIGDACPSESTYVLTPKVERKD